MTTYKTPQIFIRRLGSNDNPRGDSRIVGGDIYYVPVGKNVLCGNIIYEFQILSHQGNSNRPTIYPFSKDYVTGEKVLGGSLIDNEEARDSLRRVMVRKLEEVAERFRKSITPELRNHLR